MPHFGLMEPETMPADEAALQRSRLHIRSGRRRLAQGKISAGFATLYDAVMHAMEWKYLSLLASSPPRLNEGETPADDRHLFRILQRTGHLDNGFDYERFTRLVYRALDEDLPESYPYQQVLRDVESVMRRLGVMPFNEAALPPEDPATF